MGQFITAFGAGALSFFSPCILPLLPAYLSMISGFSAEELREGSGKMQLKRVFFRAALFCLGFSIVFIILGAMAASLGKFLSKYRTILLYICGIITIIFGIHIMGIIKLNFLNYEKRLQIKNASGNAIGAFLMGAAFAFGWSPCIGPVLGGILSLALVKGATLSGVLLLSVYSAGIALPMLITALFTAKIFSLLKSFRRHMRKIEILSGAVLIILGFLLFFDKLMFIG